MVVKNLIFVVEDAVFKNDGYKSRIEMEMEILKDDFKFYILVPGYQTQLKFRFPATIVPYKTFDSSKPFILNMYRIESALKRLLGRIGRAIIYCEALPAAVCSIKVAKNYKCKFVYDCHGTAPDEVYLYHKNILGKLYSQWLSRKQQQVVDLCDMLVTVSKNQYEVFNTNRTYALLPMVPSLHFFDEHNYKEEYRQKLGIDRNSLVFCYSGQTQKWQMIDETLRYYKKIEDKLFNTVLLVLTSNVNEFNKKIAEINIKNYKVICVSYLNMPKFLDVADFGFCLRYDHVINRVASPTKVLEYLSRNVQPIITEFVGDFSEVLERDQMASIIKKWEVDEIKLLGITNGLSYVNNYTNGLKQKYISMIRELEEENA